MKLNAKWFYPILFLLLGIINQKPPFCSNHSLNRIFIFSPFLLPFSYQLITNLELLENWFKIQTGLPPEKRAAAGKEAMKKWEYAGKIGSNEGRQYQFHNVELIKIEPPKVLPRNVDNQVLMMTHQKSYDGRNSGIKGPAQRPDQHVSSPTNSKFDKSLIERHKNGVKEEVMVWQMTDFENFYKSIEHVMTCVTLALPPSLRPQYLNMLNGDNPFKYLKSNSFDRRTFPAIYWYIMTEMINGIETGKTKIMKFPWKGKPFKFYLLSNL